MPARGARHRGRYAAKGCPAAQIPSQEPLRKSCLIGTIGRQATLGSTLKLELNYSNKLTASWPLARLAADLADRFQGQPDAVHEALTDAPATGVERQPAEPLPVLVSDTEVWDGLPGDPAPAPARAWGQMAKPVTVPGTPDAGSLKRSPCSM